MLKRVLEIVLFIVIVLLVSSGPVGVWYKTQEVEALNAANLELSAQVAQLELDRDEAIDQKDNALAELYDAKQGGDKALEHQFYRGVYAAGVVIIQSKGATIEQAAPVAIDFVEGAIKAKAYEKKWPGFDTKQEAPGTAPQLAPENPKDGDKNA